jgi:uncharacterized lipoprotein NlpE involved in copper resistance
MWEWWRAEDNNALRKATMKKEILALLAAVALIGVGCERAEDVNEPAGAERDVQMDQSTNTNTLSEPAGAESSTSDQSGAAQPDQSGTQQQNQPGQANP